MSAPLMLAILLLAVLCNHNGVTASNLQISPSEVNLLEEGSSMDLDFRLTNCTNVDELRNVSLTFVKGSNRNVAIPIMVYKIPCQLVGNDSVEGTKVKVEGKLIGIVEVNIHDTNSGMFLQCYNISIMRPPHIKDKIYLYGIMVLVIFVSLTFGISLDLLKVKGILRRPFSPGIGLACQFLLMPMIGFALTQIISVDPAQKLGVFAASVAPGGGASNIWSYLLDGDVDLSITMTLTSTIFALAFIPLWMYTLGRYIIEDDSINLPFVDMLTTLLIIIGPLFVGVLCNKFLPKLAKLVLKIQRPLICVIVMFALGMGIYANLYAFEIVFFNYQLVLSAMFLPWTGGTTAYLVALILRRDQATARTIGLETAIQNSGIATILLRTSLVAPWADISSAVPICVSLFTPFPLYFMFIIKIVYRKCTESEENKILTTSEDDETKKYDGEKELPAEEMKVQYGEEITHL